jgi:hypothetical protein
MSDYTKSDRGGSPVAGVIILGVGLYFLAVQMDYLPPVSDSWPIFLVIVGLALIVGSFVRKNRPRPDREGPPQA